MNKIVHLGLFLAIVSAVAGGALAFANQRQLQLLLKITKDKKKNHY